MNLFTHQSAPPLARGVTREDVITFVQHFFFSWFYNVYNCSYKCSHTIAACCLVPSLQLACSRSQGQISERVERVVEPHWSVNCVLNHWSRTCDAGRATYRPRIAPKPPTPKLARTERMRDLHSAFVFGNYSPWALTFIATELQRHVQLYLRVLSLSLRTPTCGSLPHVTAVTCGLSLPGLRWWWLTASRRSLSRRLHSQSQQLRRDTAGTLVALGASDAWKLLLYLFASFMFRFR